MKYSVKFLLPILVITFIAIIQVVGSNPTKENKVRSPLTPLEDGAFETKKYRNLFLEAGYANKDVDLKVQSAFDDLFSGNNKDRKSVV